LCVDISHYTDIRLTHLKANAREVNICPRIVFLCATGEASNMRRDTHKINFVSEKLVGGYNLEDLSIDGQTVSESITYLLTPWSRVLLEKLTSKLCS